jgi:hypothetical protein
MSTFGGKADICRSVTILDVCTWGSSSKRQMASRVSVDASSMHPCDATPPPAATRRMGSFNAGKLADRSPYKFWSPTIRSDGTADPRLRAWLLEGRERGKS